MYAGGSTKYSIETVWAFESKGKEIVNRVLSLPNPHISMSEIKDMADMEFDELLEQVDVGELDVVKSRINKQQDMSKELLGVISAPMDGTLSTSGMAPPDGRCGELHLRMDSCLGSSPFLSH